MYTIEVFMHTIKSSVSCMLYSPHKFPSSMHALLFNFSLRNKLRAHCMCTLTGLYHSFFGFGATKDPVLVEELQQYQLWQLSLAM
jgi:hypothetical protein